MNQDDDQAAGRGAAPDPGRVTEALLSPFGDKSPREALADRLVIKILAGDAASKQELVKLARSENPEDVEMARSIAERVLAAES